MTSASTRRTPRASALDAASAVPSSVNTVPLAPRDPKVDRVVRAHRALCQAAQDFATCSLKALPVCDAAVQIAEVRLKDALDALERDYPVVSDVAGGGG